MLIKTVSFILVCLMIGVSTVPTAVAAIPSDKKESKSKIKIKKRTAEIKAGVAKLGTGKDAKVKVKLRDKTKINGYISEFDENSFTVVDKTGNASVIEYSKAKQIKGNNLSAGTWVAIGFGAALLTVYLIWRLQDN